MKPFQLSNDSKNAPVGAAIDYFEQKQLKDDLYENAPVGYNSIDVDGVFIEINQTLLNWLGYSREEVIGKLNMSELLDAEGLELLKKVRSSFFKTGFMKDVRVNLRQKSGEWFPASISATAIFDNEGMFFRSRGVVMDYSEQSQMQDDLYENAPVGYHSINAEGVFVAMNQTELRWIGYSREEIVGKMNFTELLDEKGLERFKTYFPKIKNERTNSLELEYLFRKKSGEWLPVKLIINSVFDKAGHFLRSRTTVLDISGRKKLEAQLDEARAAERTAQLKEQFMANMSHEIRTPLNSIIGFAQLLARTELSPSQKRHVRAIETGSDALLTIVNDILDFAKMEAGQLLVEPRPFSLPELMHAVEEMFRLRAAEKRLQLIFKPLKNIPLLLEGDPMRLSQILANLISNAIKFTEKGSITVAVFLEEEREDQCVLQFTVEDTGIGIPIENQAEIFERFHQVSNEMTRRHHGSGLGLSIAKGLVEVQGGSIEVQSRVKTSDGRASGSVFIVILPFSKPASVAVELNHAFAERRPETAQNLKILVAEDNEMNRYLVQELFSGWGFDFQMVENGKLAIEAIQKNDFDLLILDIQMPEMDGYTTAKIIRNELNFNIPIIAMTAHAFPGEREKCLALGMDDYISKPFKMDDFHQIISRLAAQKRAEENKSELEISSKKLLQPHYLQQMAPGKSAFLSELAEIFLRQVPRELAILDQAAADRDWETLGQTAHNMKSTMGFMGISEIVIHAADKLETAAAKPGVNQIETGLAELRRLCEQAIEEVKSAFL